MWPTVFTAVTSEQTTRYGLQSSQQSHQNRLHDMAYSLHSSHIRTDYTMWPTVFTAVTSEQTTRYGLQSSHQSHQNRLHDVAYSLHSSHIRTDYTIWPSPHSSHIRTDYTIWPTVFTAVTSEQTTRYDLVFTAVTSEQTTRYGLQYSQQSHQNRLHDMAYSLHNSHIRTDYTIISTKATLTRPPMTISWNHLYKSYPNKTTNDH